MSIEDAVNDILRVTEECSLNQAQIECVRKLLAESGVDLPTLDAAIRWLDSAPDLITNRSRLLDDLLIFRCGFERAMGVLFCANEDIPARESALQRADIQAAYAFIRGSLNKAFRILGFYY